MRIREVIDQDFGDADRHGYEQTIDDDFGVPIDITAESPDANADVTSPRPLDRRAARRPRSASATRR